MLKRNDLYWFFCEILFDLFFDPRMNMNVLIEMWTSRSEGISKWESFEDIFMFMSQRQMTLGLVSCYCLHLMQLMSLRLACMQIPSMIRQPSLCSTNLKGILGHIIPKIPSYFLMIISIYINLTYCVYFYKVFKSVNGLSKVVAILLYVSV